MSGLACSEERLVAAATDLDLDTGLPVFGVDGFVAMCDFIERQLVPGKEPGPRVQWPSAASW